MTGDGVNDILALKEADCAISVAAGSDAARNVSHLVLLDNNFNSMPKVVFEGRRVINNVQSSSSLFLMKTLFTMLWGIITLCLPYMETYPYKLSNMIMFEIFIIHRYLFLRAFFAPLKKDTFFLVSMSSSIVRSLQKRAASDNTAPMVAKIGTKIL